MSVHKLGVQSFSIKDAVQKDLYGTLKKVAEIGYEGVEFFGAFSWSAEEVKKAADEAGLTIIGWHTPYAFIEDAFLYGTIAYAKAAGIKYITVPMIPRDLPITAETWHACAKKINDAGKVMAEHGIRMGYHNHTAEFKPVDGQLTGWDIMMQETDASITGQLDNGNALSGGRDALAYLCKYPGRAYTWHLKPYSLADGFATMIGEDSIDWKASFEEIDKQGVTEWSIVEFSCTAKYDELEGVKRCYDAIRAMGY